MPIIPEIKKISRFFHTKRNKYIFVVIDDERMLNHLVDPVIEGLEKKGKVVLHFLLAENDASVYRQVLEASAGGGIDGFMVGGLKQLIDKYGDSCIDSLNKARDAFDNVGLPIIWLVDTLSLQKIIRGASDFYQLRHLPDFHIASVNDEKANHLDINFFYNPNPGDVDTDPGFLERRLEGFSSRIKNEKEILNSIVVPLLRIYIADDDIEKMKALHANYIVGREHLIHDEYILIAYYTAIGMPEKSPLFPRRNFHLLPDFGHTSDVSSPLEAEYLKALEAGKGAVVVCGNDGPGKRGLLGRFMGTLREKDFDFIVVYGEIVPEQLLIHIALSARDRGDKNAVKTVVSPVSVEDKLAYFVHRFFARHKITVLFKHFEVNQSPPPARGCKSGHLSRFLQRFGDLLQGMDSLLVFDSCWPLPAAGFVNLDCRDESNTPLVTRRIADLANNERELMEVLSVYRYPVAPDALSYHGLSPDDRETRRNLENRFLLKTVAYTGDGSAETFRIYVPPAVSSLVRKGMSGERTTRCHLKAADYFEKFPGDTSGSFIERIIELRHHFCAAGEWNKAAEATLNVFWPLHAQNYLKWAYYLLSTLETERLTPALAYHVQRRLGMLHYYSGAYVYSWSYYQKALEAVDRLDDPDERHRLYSEIIVIETELNRDLSPTDKPVFKGISRTIQKPPLEIIKNGPKAIRQYLKESEKAAVPLLECKLIIVGDGNVGKTSLMRKLMDLTFQVDIGREPTTHGIHIEPWKLPVTFNDGVTRDMNIRFWDFGGQDIYYSTHQFFMTGRSLYIFVWEARKEDSYFSFDYWLNTIRLLGKDSPVIVVMNKADVRVRSIDEAGIAEKFKNIVGFYRVSCKSGSGIPELTEEIQKNLARMPHVLDKIPMAWGAVRDELSGMDRSYITIEEYMNICRSYGLDREKATFLSQYLHDLGVILHFQSDFVLEKMVILNPAWLTRSFYRLIDSRAIRKADGRFKLQELRNHWNPVEYPPDIHQKLIRLMETVGLCFSFSGTDTYVIPNLLPSERPAISYEQYNTLGGIRFQYQYDFMPPTLLNRFISANYYLVRGENVWRNGVELQFEDSGALVVSDRYERSLRVWVTGSQKRELAAIIRNEFQRIHRSLNMEKGEHYREMIPCTCPQCSGSDKPYLFDYDVLMGIRAKGKTTVDCMGSADEIAVDSLLYGFEPPNGRDFKTSLISAADSLKSYAGNIRSDEDSRNNFLSVLLEARGFIVKERARLWRSASGKSIDLVDVKIDLPGGGTAIIETFSLPVLDKKIIESHLKKFFSYDVEGLAHSYILVYAENSDFDGLWKKYINYLPEVELIHPLIGSPVVEETGFEGIRMARAHYEFNTSETVVHHIFINMNP